MVGVSDAGSGRSRPRRKRGIGAGYTQGELLPQGARPRLAAGLDESGYPVSARSFSVEEPVSDFTWLFRNRDGSIAERPTSIDDYLTFRRMYGVPEGRWSRG